MKRGTVVLTPFPFTDLSATKVRPAVIVSPSDRPGEDVILAFVSSVKPLALLPTDLSPALLVELNTCLRAALGL